MAGNIIDYVKAYGNCDLREMPINDVDSLVLCQLAYLKFDGIVSDVRENGPSIALKAIKEHRDYERIYADERYEKVNRELFEAAADGKRFGNMKLNCYINLVEKEWETQFAAVTFLLEDGTVYIAFRGTDETLVGWKEDFNMAFLSPIPAQSYSVKYLNIVAGQMHRKFYVGGHSKGGNLAVYSSMNCIPQVQERIQKIYSMDGPGFRPEILKECGYEIIENRVVKIVPHSSFIGRVFEQDNFYTTVESRKFGLAQHNPYHWLVEEGHFVLVEDIYESSKAISHVVNHWILSLNEQQLKTLSDTLYQVLSASEADDLITFAADWKKSLSGMITAWEDVDEQTRRGIVEVMRLLFHSLSKRPNRKEVRHRIEE